LGGGRIGGKGRGGEKGWKRVGRSLRGKIFRENSGNPQIARRDKDLLRPKDEISHPFGGDHLPLPPPCLRPYVWVLVFFMIIRGELWTPTPSVNKILVFYVMWQPTPAVYGQKGALEVGRLYFYYIFYNSCIYRLNLIFLFI